MSTKAKVFVLLFTLVFTSFSHVAMASSWYSLMRKGDDQMAAGNYDRAKQYYLGALDAAGSNATSQLWEKYNRAYSKSLAQSSSSFDSHGHVSRVSGGVKWGRKQEKKESVSPKNGDGLSPAPESVASEDVSTGPSDVSTSPRYVEILPDGTVRMTLDDYMRDAKISRFGSANRGKNTASNGSSGSSESDGSEDETDSSAQQQNSISARSYWGQPVSDSTGERKAFGSSEKVGLKSVLSEATSGENLVGDVEVTTSDYRVHDIEMKFKGARKLVVTGKVTNTSSSPVHNARVYVRLYNETGVFKGRKWSYLKPGRQSLMPGKTKKFKIEFGGYTGTVGSYKVEVIADFKK